MNDDLALYLRYLAYAGAIERYGLDPEIFENDEYANYPDEVRDRIDHELDVIEKAGFPGYFLIVADLLRFCRERGIPTGPGRGSVCGSAVAYATRITDVDPLRWGIPFERFLHLERVAMPDVDLDICQARRSEVIDYLRERYGRDSVAQIITFGTLMAKGVVKDVVRILHIDEQLYGIHGNPTGARLSELIPEGSGADQIKLAEFAQTPQGQKFYDEIAGLEVYVDGRKSSVWDTCIRLEGTRKHSSVHAAGVVIADRPLIELAPLYKRNKDAEVQVSYDMRDLEEIGLLKFDVLGLRTVTVIGGAEENVRRHHPEFRIKEVPLDDRATFELLQKGDTGGVFQLEGDGITAAFTGIVPDRFEDIVAILALYRPGPLEQLGAYIDRKHGKEKVAYPHPDLEPILKTTYGLIVFQEQVMGIVRVMGGYTAGAADMFRKAIGKKLPELIKKEIELFETAAITRGYDERVVRQIAESIAYFGRYGFNLGHATGYAYITYWTAYLKANYPTEWYCALLNSYTDDAAKLAGVLREAKAHGVEVLAPDINESGTGFTIQSPGTIRFGLSAVKGLGETAALQIVEERDCDEKSVYQSVKEKRFNEEKQKEYTANLRQLVRVPNEPRPYTDVVDFCRRLPSIPVNVKQALVVAGAFTTDVDLRRSLHAAMPKLNEQAKKGRDYDWGSVRPELSELELVRLEREVMGLYVTGHPLEIQREALDQYGAWYEGAGFEELPGSCTIAGLVVEIKLHEAKTGQMAWVTVENAIQGMPRITMFPQQWKLAKDRITKDAIVVVRGKRDDHPKFGWGFIADHVRVLDRSRPSAKILRVIVPYASALDILNLRAILQKHYVEKGTRVQVLLHGERPCLLSLEDDAILTGELLEQIKAEGWVVQMDPDPREPVLLEGERYVEARPFKGKDRKPAWEDTFIAAAMEKLGGAFLFELKRKS